MSSPLSTFIQTFPAARIVFGEGTAATLADEAALLSISRALVLCSPGRRDVAERLAGPFAPGAAVICDASAPNMPQEAFDVVMAAIEAEGADGLVTVGGGSPIGLGKAIAAATKLPYIAVVTTYSGSERAPNWYLRTSRGATGGGGDGKRVGGTSPDALPRTVIYDPELTLDLPPATSAASGMNAMAHAVESLYGPDTTPVIQILAEEAVRLLGESLPAIMRDPGDHDARGKALYAAWLAAEFRATSGLEHVLAQRIRSRFGLGHAQSHAVMTPYAIAYNAPAAPEAMRRIERALGANNAAPQTAAQALHALNRTLGLAAGLSEMGLTEADLDAATDAVMGAKYPNPRPAEREDIRRIVAEALRGEPPVG